MILDRVCDGSLEAGAAPPSLSLTADVEEEVGLCDETVAGASLIRERNIPETCGCDDGERTVVFVVGPAYNYNKTRMSNRWQMSRWKYRFSYEH